jgi:hypothetical protein
MPGGYITAGSHDLLPASRCPRSAIGKPWAEQRGCPGPYEPASQIRNAACVDDVNRDEGKRGTLSPLGPGHGDRSNETRRTRASHLRLTHGQPSQGSSRQRRRARRNCLRRFGMCQTGLLNDRARARRDDAVTAEVVGHSFLGQAEPPPSSTAGVGSSCDARTSQTTSDTENSRDTHRLPFDNPYAAGISLRNPRCVSPMFRLTFPQLTCALLGE